MRIGLLLGLPLALSALLAARMADAALVHVVDTQYNVTVRAAFAGDDLTRSTTSLTPTSDHLSLADDNEPTFCLTRYACASAFASADLFAVEAQTAAYPLVVEPYYSGYSHATAESTVTFEPLSDGTAAFSFSIALLPGGNQVGLYWSEGFARLEDLTVSEVLWDYAWNYGLTNGHPTTWPFDGQYGPSQSLAVDQPLDAAHLYLLTMHISSEANTDREHDALFLSGLEAVPEPSSAILLGSAIALMACCRRYVGVLLAASALLAPLMADAAPVQLLEAQYHVSVQGSLTGPEGTEPINIGPRSTTSLSPISDTGTITDGLGAVASASASAGLFTVNVETFGGSDLVRREHAGATAESVITFAPLVDGDATFYLSIDSGSALGITFSDGLAQLEDLTTGSVLWDYGWSYFSCCLSGYTPWPGTLDRPSPLSVDQALDATHEYVLTMHISSNSADDHEHDTLSLSGLEAVPEPSSAILLGLVALGLCGTRRVQ